MDDQYRWRVAGPIFVLGALALAALVPPLGAGAEEARTLRLADGVDMAYVDRGTGSPALVFIHCGTCRMGIWQETLDAFAPTHRVVAMDLVGHGRSGANRENVTIAGLGKDVAALADHLRLEKVILIGNSLGGPVGLEAAKALGKERALGVVAVDTLQNVESVWPEEHFKQTLDRFRADFATACDEYMLALVPRTSTQAVKDRVARDTCECDAKAFRSLFATIRTYDQAAALRGAGVPVRAINSTVFPTAVDVNRKHAASFEVTLMDGVGHFPQAEQPAEFQKHLRRLVQELAAKR